MGTVAEGRSGERAGRPNEVRASNAARVPVVGRAAELEGLRRELRRSALGEFRVVLIVGEPGVGKTRLSAEFLTRVAAGRSVVSARAYPLGSTASFALWAEGLDRFLGDLPADAVRRLCGSSIDQLATLLRSTRALVSPGVTTRPDRHGLLDALAVLLSNMAHDAEVVVVLDDIHLADGSSWEALHFLAHRLAGERVLVVATARHAELAATTELHEVVLALEQDAVIERLVLAPLAAEHVAELARHLLGRDVLAAGLVNWLAARSGGHPLFVIGLLRALVEEGGDLDQPVLRRLPEALSERVTVRLRSLDAEDRELLEILAVLGRRVEIGELTHITERSLDRLGISLERLARARLVTEQEPGSRLTYELSHPLIQEAIYQDIGGARRRTLHRLVARTLLASGSLGAAAPHFARSVSGDDAEAIDALCDAVREAEARNLPREAGALTRALLDLLGPGDERWLRVLDSMDWQAEWVMDHLVEGDAQTAIEAMRRISGVLEGSGDLEREGAVLFRMASFLNIGAGHADAALPVCQRALELFERAGLPRQAMMATNELGWIRGCAGDQEGHAAAASAVLAKAEAAGDATMVIQALGALGAAEELRGNLVTAERVLRRGIELAARGKKTYRLAWNRMVLSNVMLVTGRVDDAIETIEQILDGPWAIEALGLESATQVYWLAGRFPDAIEIAEKIVSLNPLALSCRRAGNVAQAARMLGEMGRRAQAQAWVHRAAAAYEGRDFYYWSPMCPWAEGILAWQAGNDDTALASLDAASARLLDIDALWLGAVALADLAEVAVACGAPGRACRAASRLDEVAGRVTVGLVPELARLGRAFAALATGNRSEAVEPARAAAEGLGRYGYRFYAAVANGALAIGLEHEDRARAVDALRAAADGFAACGAEWRTERVLRRLESLGSQGRRAASSQRGPDSLTARELEVAQLAARGLTAAEIGERLFIGRRTVETHLSRVYAKLDVSSKRELERAASKLGLLEADP